MMIRHWFWPWLSSPKLLWNALFGGYGSWSVTSTPPGRSSMFGEQWIAITMSLWPLLYFFRGLKTPLFDIYMCEPTQNCFVLLSILYMECLRTNTAHVNSPNQRIFHQFWLVWVLINPFLVYNYSDHQPIHRWASCLALGNRPKTKTIRCIVLDHDVFRTTKNPLFSACPPAYERLLTVIGHHQSIISK